MKRKLVQSDIILMIIAFILFVVVVGCSTTKAKITTGIGLETTRDIFIAAGKTAEELRGAGFINNADWAVITVAHAEGKLLLINAHAIWEDMAGRDSFDLNSNYSILLDKVGILTGRIEAIIRNSGGT